MPESTKTKDEAKNHTTNTAKTRENGSNEIKENRNRQNMTKKLEERQRKIGNLKKWNTE